MPDMQNNKTPADLFNKNASSVYNERQQKLAPITDNLHFLINLVLHELTEEASILCVGVGTGTEIIKLAQWHPHWRFVGVDPSADMLNVCRLQLEEHGLSHRVALFHGYLTELPGADKFNAVLCLLVSQFIKADNERQMLFDMMASRLDPKGYLINAELSADLETPEFYAQLEAWKAMQSIAGSTQEQVANILPVWKEHVSILPPASIERFLRRSGFAMPIPFFQSLLIHAWYSRKS